MPSQSKPFTNFGETTVELQAVSNKKRSNEHVSEPRLKVRRSGSERQDSLILELSSNDSKSISSPLPSPSLDDDESTHTPQQVSQFGPPAEDLSAYNVAPSNQMYEAGNVGAAASEQLQFGTSGLVSEVSSVGQLVGNIPTSTVPKILTVVSTKLQENKHVLLQKQTPQHDEAKWQQQFSSPEIGEMAVRGPTDVLVTTTSNVLPPHQQETFSQNTVLQSPVEARLITRVSPTVQAHNCHIYVSDAIQNSTSVGVNQQVVDLESEHPSSGYDGNTIYR
jgi:hypothetical protein